MGEQGLLLEQRASIRAEASTSVALAYTEGKRGLWESRGFYWSRGLLLEQGASIGAEASIERVCLGRLLIEQRPLMEQGLLIEQIRYYRMHGITFE